MSNLESKKLSSEDMEKVTGGTRDQTRAIKEALYKKGVVSRKISITDELLLDILSANNITAQLNSGKKLNSYVIIKNNIGKRLSQDMLLDMIKNGEIDY